MSVVKDVVNAAKDVVTVTKDLVECIMGQGGSTYKEVQDPKLVEELKAYREQNGKLVEQYADIVKKMEEKKVTTFDELQEKSNAVAADLVRLAKETQPVPMTGNNIGFFGITSSGKSSVVNQLLGPDADKHAEVGKNETTKAVEKFPARNGQYTLYDLPGSTRARTIALPACRSPAPVPLADSLRCAVAAAGVALPVR